MIQRGSGVACSSYVASIRAPCCNAQDGSAIRHPMTVSKNGEPRKPSAPRQPPAVPPGEGRTQTFSKLRLFALVQAVVFLVSLWCFRYFPSTDGPSHLYNIEIYEQPDNPVYRGYYVRRAVGLSNAASFHVGRWLSRVMPLLQVEKTTLSLIYLVWAAGLWAVAGLSGRGQKEWSFILLLPVSMNFFLRMGFHNFTLASGLCLLLFSVLWRFEERPTWRWVFLAVGLSLALALTHLLAFGLALVAILLVAFLRGPRDPRSWVIAIPPILIFGWLSVTESPPSEHLVWDSPLRLLLRLARLDFMIGWSAADYLLSASLWLLLFISLWRGWERNRDSFSWRTMMQYRVLLPVLYLILFFLFPERTTGGTYINTRTLLIGFLAVLPVLVHGILWLRDRPWGKYALGGLLLIQGVWFGSSLYVAYGYDREVRTLMRQGENLEGRLLLYVCRDPEGRFHRVSPYLHLDNWFALEHRLCSLSNYEAITPFFHTAFAKPVPKLEWRREGDVIRIRNLNQLADVDAVMIYGPEEVIFEAPNWQLFQDPEYPAFKILLRESGEGAEEG